MRLTALRVLNFRTLEDINVTFAGFYTAVSGQNNAGKTSLVRAIRNTFKDVGREFYYMRRRDEISYRDDKTQWVKGTPDIEFDYELAVSADEDPGLFKFLEKFNEETIPGEEASLRVVVSHKPNDEIGCSAWVNGKELSSFAAREVDLLPEIGADS